MPDTRKLAAIMFTDIKDFTVRMHSRERLGMRLLETHNGIMDEALRAHGGVLVKNIGDAYLVDFSSAVNALEAAVEAQERFAQHNAGCSAEEQVLVRISIHLGDVVMHDGDLFGDGVNIASRLQAITPPGGICISREVYTQVRSTLSVEAAALGPFELKGVAEPVEVYQVPTALAPKAVEPASAPRGGAAPAEAPDLSIAVLPFVNRSEDQDNEYFSDGISEDIITDLAKISALRVSSRNSAFSFKGKNASARQVGRELAVRYVLEGSVRRAGGRIRITAQLVDTRSEAHLWAERFDRDFSDIFAVQDEIAHAIVSELHVRLTRPQQQSLENHGTRSLPAYDAYLKGLFHSRKRTVQDLAIAEEHLKEALRLDPDFARAHAALAWILRYRSAFGFDRGPDLAVRARRHTERALQVDPSLPDALLMTGLTQRDAGEVAESIQTLQALVEKFPSHASGHQYLGSAFRDAGMIDEALQHHLRAMELDPQDFVQPLNLCYDLAANGDFPAMVPYVERAAALAPAHPLVLQYRAILAALAGDAAAAESMVVEMERSSPTMHAPALRGQLLLAWGRSEEAYEQFARARALGGTDPSFPALCINGLMAMRKLDDASAIIEGVLAGGQSRIVAGVETRTLLYYAKGMIARTRGDKGEAANAFARAREEAERWKTAFPRSPLLCAIAAVTLALTGDHEAAAAEILRIQRVHPSFRRLPYYRAVICAERGDRAGLFADLLLLRAQGTAIWWGLKDDIAFSRYAGEAEFIQAAGSAAPA